MAFFGVFLGAVNSSSVVGIVLLGRLGAGSEVSFLMAILVARSVVYFSVITFFHFANV